MILYPTANLGMRHHLSKEQSSGMNHASDAGSLAQPQWPAVQRVTTTVARLFSFLQSVSRHEMLT